MNIKNPSALFFINIFVLLSLTVFSQTVYANGVPACPSGSVCLNNPLTATSTEGVVNSIINVIFVLALAITPLMIIISGFYWVTSAGDPKKIEQAKNIIIYTAIGLSVILLSKALVAAIKMVLSAQ